MIRLNKRATILDVMEELNASGEVEVRGFGRFHVASRPPYETTHPGTGERIEVPARRTVRFSPSRMLKGMVND